MCVVLVYLVCSESVCVCVCPPPQLGESERCLSPSQMILFCACCICGLISGILNVQFVRAAARRADVMSPLQAASMALACLGMGVSTLSAWLTCRLASAEQQRMFLERELSLHHSVEMTEKNKAGCSSSK